MEEKKKISSIVKDKIKEIKSNWKKAPEGKYVSYKELLAYSVGGAGVYFIFSLVGMITLTAGSMIVGASIGIKAIDLQTMNALSIVLSLLIAPARAMMFDNTRSKMGKFRPYILWLGLPTAVLGTAFVYMPYETMEYSEKCITVFVFYTLLQFFSPFYQSAYVSLVQVLSPNSRERGWIIEISSIIYSFAPTVINPVLPLIGKMEDISTYRKAFPVFCILGLAVSMLAVFGTEEKIIVPKSYVQKTSFREGLRKVSKNKYFWIINSSNWLGFLNTGYGNIFQWIFYYGMNNPTLYALMVVLKGEASTPGMVLAAPIMNKIGKKKICLLSILVQAACIAMMLACYKNYVLVFVFMFLKDMFGALSIIYIPAMNADMMDYQQYKTGDRLEGFIGQTGPMLTSVISLGTGYAIPVILKGLGFTNNYDALYNADFRNPLVYALLICSLIGTAMSAIPFFFYDLNENKRGNMIKVLKIRAVFEDYINGEFSEEKFLDVVKDVDAAETILAHKQEYKSEDIKGAELTVNELKKYSAEEYREKLETAERIFASGLSGLSAFDAQALVEARKLTASTKAEKKAKKEKIEHLKALERSATVISVHYPEGIREFDKSRIDSVNGMPESTSAERKEKKQAMKKLGKELELYNIATKPFREAEAMLKMKAAYEEYDALKEKYISVN